MRKILMMLIVTLGVSLLFTSCQSKEEQFLDDMRSLVEKAEKTDNPAELVSLSLKAAKLEQKYGKDWEPNFTEEQEAEMAELSSRFAAASAKSMSSGVSEVENLLGGLESFVSDIEKDPDPTDSE